MEDRPTHKRSKSSRIMNVLRGDQSQKDGASDTSSSHAERPLPSPAIQSSNQNPMDSTRLSPLTPTVSKTPSTNMSAEQNEALAAPDTTSVPSGLAPTSVASVEDSVRTFRVFEILRAKDTAAISKSIKDGQPIPGTTILHLAIQCAEPPVVEQVLKEAKDLDPNTQDREGNTPLHLAAHLGRTQIVKRLLDNTSVNDAINNKQGKAPIDLARTPEIFQMLQLSRTIFLDNSIKQIQAAVAQNDYKLLETLLEEIRVATLLDVNALELPTETVTTQTGGTLLHEAARKKDLQLAQLLLLHGADPFRRDRKGKLPQDVTKDERTRAILKKSPAAAVAQRGIQEKAILGSSGGHARSTSAAEIDTGKESREMKGYLKKWTNYTTGYKLRWFVLEDGVLSYYKNQDDAGSACRGAINMKIAKLYMDPQDKSRFEIQGKSSVKYHLKANHVVEAKRWFWSLNNAIQYSKDEAKDDEKRKTGDPDLLRTKADGTDYASSIASARSKQSGLGVSQGTTKVSFRSDVDATSVHDYQASEMDDELHRAGTNTGGPGPPMDADDEMDGDDMSSEEHHRPGSKDAFNITAQSAKLQIDLLARAMTSMSAKQKDVPDTKISDPEIVQAITTYSSAVSTLNVLVSDLLRISRDRDAYWQYRLDRDADARRMWEESMAKIAYEHEDLQKLIAESEDKRKRTKRALKDALEGQTSRPPSQSGFAAAPAERVQFAEAYTDKESVDIRPEGEMMAARSRRKSLSKREGNRRKSVIAQMTDLSDSESGDDAEFFDAIETGDIEVVDEPLKSPPLIEVSTPKASQVKEDPLTKGDARTAKQQAIVPSFAGYENGLRKKLKMDADDRPKISLWGILKSMIGKDMTKMTLPVSFNEPTSLLQRVAEDMEYADLLDIAADRTDSMERLVYVAAFAASEYASTIGRVAKPFNPLLGETYEYVRPDKGYRFFIEQVSHHPPVGAAYAESARWDYWGESAVRSKFYGKSFDINPLGTWFLRLRPASGGKAELYTWKKVTSSVIGIITGAPTVDNYGPMEVKNWTTGEVCVLDFKARGWKASSAYQVFGKATDKTGVTKFSIGGRWNDKIYARRTEGFEDEAVGEGKATKGAPAAQQAFLVWEANARPTGIPFNLTPFVLTLNALDDDLKGHIAPTDTRLRPDQRAMEDGEYDFAATEKNRVEEKQRAARRVRENAGEEWKAKWFSKKVDDTTGEEYWENNGRYWANREKKDWSVCDDIF